MKVFISGKMTGIEDYNRPLFNKVEKELIEKGHTVLNPAILPEGLETADYRRICKAMIQSSDCLLLLKGWEDSIGANEELDMANDMNKKIFLYRMEEVDNEVISNRPSK